MTRLNPPRSVLEIGDRIEGAGHEAWFVGGAIRDALLGHPHLDWDIATSATPDQVKALFGARRTIPVGVEFGTVGVLDDDGILHEVTTFRRDVKTDGRHAVVEFGVSLDDDLARRDFTINAIAYSASRDEIRDPFDGRGDLSRRLVRAVGDADARMREDRLRALRGIRFAARFDFDIEPSTAGAIARSAPDLGRLSAERVKQELEKTMDQVARPSRALGLWKSTGALSTLIPALAALDDRTIAALDRLAMPGLARRPRRRLDRLGLLFLDLPPKPLLAALASLRFSRQDTAWIAALAERWRALGPAMRDAACGGAPIDDATIRRWVAVVGRTRIGAFMRSALAMWMARSDVDATAVRAIYRRMLSAAFRDPVEIADLAVDGDDLRRVGIPPGPLLGKILHELLQTVLDEPARNTTDWLLHESRRLQALAAGTRGQTLTGGGD